MSAEDLERYETEIELQLYREYRDVLPMFSYVVETERRFYLTNSVELRERSDGGRVYFELELADATTGAERWRVAATRTTRAYFAGAGEVVAVVHGDGALEILLITFLMICYFMVLFTIIGDLFRNHNSSGWAKAGWIIGLIFLPLITALIYVIVNGKQLFADGRHSGSYPGRVLRSNA